MGNSIRRCCSNDRHFCQDTLPAWLRARQIRITIRAAFSVFLLVAILLPYLTIRHQKERNDAEQAKFQEAAEQRVVDRLLSPAGQLALLNPSRVLLPATPLRPVILPFTEIQADMPGVVLDQVRAVGCPIQFKATHDAVLDHHPRFDRYTDCGSSIWCLRHRKLFGGRRIADHHQGGTDAGSLHVIPPPDKQNLRHPDLWGESFTSRRHRLERTRSQP